VRAEGRDHRNVRRVAASGDQDAANPARVVAGIKGVPAAADIGFHPGIEIHRRGVWRHANIAYPAGGWFPLLVGFIALTLMLVWRKGRRVAFEQRDQNAIDLATFIASLDQPNAPERMNGTAVYLTKETHLVPAALELNVRHNGIVHKNVVLLKVTTEHLPRADEGSRVRATPLPSGFRLLWLVFGFAEKPDVPAALRLRPEALGCYPDGASFFLGRETPVPSLRPHLSGWQQWLYAFMTRNAVSAPDYFLIPSARVVELGTRVEM
jgi:KUP system potassium uptake protein